MTEMKAIFGSLDDLLVNMIDDEVPEDDISGNPNMKFAELVSREDLQVGTWSCTPCDWQIDFHEENEVMLVLSGRVRITGKDEEPRELTKGDVFFIPRGWAGRWETIETMEKLYVIID